MKITTEFRMSITEEYEGDESVPGDVDEARESAWLEAQRVASEIECQYLYLGASVDVDSVYVGEYR